MQDRQSCDPLGLGTGRIAYAAALGLDVRRFAHELAEGVHLPRVREDFLSGARSGVNGTPTFFTDQMRYDGPVRPAALIRELEAVALALARR
jgi:hypothetical protein